MLFSTTGCIAAAILLDSNVEESSDNLSPEVLSCAGVNKLRNLSAALTTETTLVDFSSPSKFRTSLLSTISLILEVFSSDVFIESSSVTLDVTAGTAGDVGVGDTDTVDGVGAAAAVGVATGSVGGVVAVGVVAGDAVAIGAAVATGDITASGFSGSFNIPNCFSA
jgi:hypothetical protein